MPKIVEVQDYAARQKRRELEEWAKLVRACFHNMSCRINMGASSDKYTVLDLKSATFDAKFYCSLPGHREHAKVYAKAYVDHDATPELPPAED